jgi:uncharacterized membrane protein
MDAKIKKHGREAHSRTVAKAISWRIIATLTTMTAVYIFTGEWLITIGVGIVEVVAKITFYYLHERIWNKIHWGKERHPLSTIPIKGEIKPEDMDKIKAQLRDLGYLD